MSCMFRIFGVSLDVDALLKTLTIPPVAVFRADAPGIRTRHKSGSGANFEVSKADFDEFHAQIEDSCRFLDQNRLEIMKIIDFKGIDKVCLDFSSSIKLDMASRSISFPSTLLRQVADLKIELELTVYAIDEDL